MSIYRDNIVGFMIRPQVAISSCLMGERVRYDGQHKRSAYLVDQFNPFIEPLSVCPEVNSGMSVPRAPIQLRKTDFNIILQDVAPPHHDHTASMQRFVLKLIEQSPYICGLITKSKSPSCGVTDTPMIRDKDNSVHYGSGYYVRLMRRECPHLPVIDDKAVLHQDYRHRFLLHCFTLGRFFQQVKINPENGARSFHNQHHLLFQSIDPVKSKELKQVLELWTNGKATQQNYLTYLAHLLQKPFKVSHAFKALEHFISQQDKSLQSSLRIIFKTLKQQDNDQWISALFAKHISQLSRQLTLDQIGDNPFFMPYPIELMAAAN